MAYRLKHYVDDDGRQLVHKIPIDGSKGVYVGLFTVKIEENTMPIQFNFPDDYSVKMCFENYDRLSAKEYQDLVKEGLEAEYQNLTKRGD